MKLQRVLLILFYIMKKGKTSTKELCEFLEVSKRTVYRDIDVLKTAGAEIISTSGTGGGHRLSEDFNLGRLLFTNRELDSILLGSDFLSQFSQMEFADVSRELVKKLKGLMSTKENAHIDQSCQKVLIDSNYSFHKEDYFNKLKIVETAVNEDTLIYIKYKSPLCEKMSVSGFVAPYGIINWVGYWYIAGYCYVSDCYRAFNVAFIENILLTEEKFVRNKEFKLQEFWKNQISRR